MKTQIVVTGGGAGGLELVRRLGAKLLVERNRTHIWKPLLHEVAAGSLDANLDEVGYGSHGYRWKYRYFYGNLETIDRDARQVVIAPERAQEVAEIVGEGMKLKADGVGGERAAREPRPSDRSLPSLIHCASALSCQMVQTAANCGVAVEYWQGNRSFGVDRRSIG